MFEQQQWDRAGVIYKAASGADWESAAVPISSLLQSGPGRVQRALACFLGRLALASGLLIELA